ncbi:99_t:CDS:2 [Cetraspora pellucida]|uniref:99_t:CDS:1 n=1 Tax=Cetraspora pellucida TaxID=1433469 RepID=A0A9N8VIM1_9GLOM|nr:99_t:CDS:2 [Cetraspora pellucida]
MLLCFAIMLFFFPPNIILCEKDEEKFILVDTPGFTNEKNSSNEVWSNIDKIIDNSYEHGVHAILFGQRFSSDRRSHLDECMKKLNNKNVIMVFTKCNMAVTNNPENMKDSFADFIKEYIKKVNNRWVVAPDPNIFAECNDVITKNMNDLKTMISKIEEPWKKEKKHNLWHIPFYFTRIPTISMIPTIPMIPTISTIFAIFTILAYLYMNVPYQPELTKAKSTIFLIGETGSGKSMLGNFIGNITGNELCRFEVKRSKVPVTKYCEECSFTINNNVYNVIDTPGLNHDSIQKIDESIHKNLKINGTKAIFFVLDPIYYESFNNTKEVMKQFDDQAIKIAVFTKLNKDQINKCAGKKSIEKCLEEITEDTKKLLKDINYNWTIFPNQDLQNDVISKPTKELKKWIETHLNIVKPRIN